MAKSIIGKNRRSALEQAGVEGRTFRKASISLEEVVNTSIVRLHSLLERPFREDAPFDLPAGTGTCSGGDPAVLCLRPGEWLLVSEMIPARDILQQLADLVDPGQTSALDASDGLTLFRLTGAGAPWLLSKLSCLDFLAGKNHGAHCARTKMGHVATVVHYYLSPGGLGVFDLVVDRSFAKYLWLMLLESVDHAEELTKTYGDAA